MGAKKHQSNRGAPTACLTANCNILNAIVTMGVPEKRRLSLFDTLQIGTIASEGELKRAYRRLAILSHPHKDPSPNAAHQFEQVSKAYQVLSQPSLKAVYLEEVGPSGKGDGGGCVPGPLVNPLLAFVRYFGNGGLRTFLNQVEEATQSLSESKLPTQPPPAETWPDEKKDQLYMPSSGTADTTPGSSADSTSKAAELTEEQLEQRVARSAAGFLDHLRPFLEDGEEGRLVFEKKVQVKAEESRLTLWGIKLLQAQSSVLSSRSSAFQHHARGTFLGTASAAAIDAKAAITAWDNKAGVLSAFWEGESATSKWREARNGAEVDEHTRAEFCKVMRSKLINTSLALSILHLSESTRKQVDHLLDPNQPGVGPAELLKRAEAIALMATIQQRVALTTMVTAEEIKESEQLLDLLWASPAPPPMIDLPSPLPIPQTKNQSLAT